MEIAIVGAGFCGLAAAWNLLQIPGTHIDLFDITGIGGGASGVAAGLLHPYVGEAGKKSWMAEEAMKATLELLDVAERALGNPVADRAGITRVGKIHQLFDDTIPQSDGSYLITSGITVYSELYLKGLFCACQELGTLLHRKVIDSLDALSNYDKIILTAGAGIFSFQEAQHLKLQKTKGQVLLCGLPSTTSPLERSIVGKGYLAKAQSPDIFYAGSTYERGEITDIPCIETAKADLLPKIMGLDARFQEAQVLECRAGIRVGRRGHYIPLLEQLSKKCYAVTSMGSRGLLYHAYFAKQLLKNIQIP